MTKGSIYQISVNKTNMFFKKKKSAEKHALNDVKNRDTQPMLVSYVVAKDNVPHDQQQEKATKNSDLPEISENISMEINKTSIQKCELWLDKYF